MFYRLVTFFIIHSLSKRYSALQARIYSYIAHIYRYLNRLYWKKMKKSLCKKKKQKVVYFARGVKTNLFRNAYKVWFILRKARRILCRVKLKKSLISATFSSHEFYSDITEDGNCLNLINPISRSFIHILFKFP